MSSALKFNMMIWILIIFMMVAGIGYSSHKLLEATGLVDNPENIESSDLWIALIGIFALIELGAIFIGIYSRANVKDIAIGSYLGASAIVFALEFTNIILFVKGQYYGHETWGWVFWVVTGLFGMLFIGYIQSLLDFYQGGT